jgi:hypothetical protein
MKEVGDEKYLVSFSGNGCRLRRSTQHLREVYLQEFGILRSFWVVDSRAARLGKGAPDLVQRLSDFQRLRILLFSTAENRNRFPDSIQHHL